MKRQLQHSIIEFKCSKSLRKDTYAEQEKKSKCLGNLKLKSIKELDKFKLPLNKQVLERFLLYKIYNIFKNTENSILNFQK